VYNPTVTFVELLKQSGWSEHKPFEFRKSNWVIVFDTSSWLEIGTGETPRIFDVPVPDDDKAKWTLSLIEHLCKTDDELQNLKAQRGFASRLFR